MSARIPATLASTTMRPFSKVARVASPKIPVRGVDAFAARRAGEPFLARDDSRAPPCACPRCAERCTASSRSRSRRRACRLPAAPRRATAVAGYRVQIGEAEQRSIRAPGASAARASEPAPSTRRCSARRSGADRTPPGWRRCPRSGRGRSRSAASPNPDTRRTRGSSDSPRVGATTTSAASSTRRLRYSAISPVVVQPKVRTMLLGAHPAGAPPRCRTRAGARLRARSGLRAGVPWGARRRMRESRRTAVSRLPPAARIADESPYYLPHALLSQRRL